MKGIQKSDKVSLNAEIVGVNHDKHTVSILIPATPGSDQKPKIIELDQSYLSNCVIKNNPPPKSKHKTPQTPKSSKKPSDTVSFFTDNDVSVEKVIGDWKQLLITTSHGLGIDDVSNTMEGESGQQCDAWFLNECPQIQRLSFIQQFYKLWIEKNVDEDETEGGLTFSSITELFLSLEGYSSKQLLNDFHHLKLFHINMATDRRKSSDDVYDYFKRHCTDGTHCEDRNCRCFVRNTRDREKCRDPKYRRNLYFIRDKTRDKESEIEEMNAQDLLDTVHSSLIHYEPGEMSMSDKFVTHFKTDDDDTKESKTSGEYGFGLAFKYGDKSSKSSYYCPKKYDSLKPELLNNNIYNLEAFEYESLYKKAELFLCSWNAKQMWNANSMGLWNKNYGIEAGSPATGEHILVLMSYTNMDYLQREFKKTYRRSYPDEDRKEVTARHSEIANWASLLDQTITFFSERLIDDNALFYHGINCQLKFTQFEAFFFSPTSTTIIPQIAYNFASKKGVVIALGKSDSRGPVFVNVSFLSDYPKEEERLIMCNNWSFNNIIYNGISTQVYVKCLKLFQRMVDGSFVVDDKQLYHIKYQKVMIRMMDNYMNKRNDNENIPSYLQELFNYFCDNIDTIWINEREFTSYIDELQKYLTVPTAPGQESKSQFKLSNLIFKKKKQNEMKLGVFPQYLNVKLQRVSYCEWKITEKQLDAFWMGNRIPGPDIKCDISHLIEKQSDQNKFTFNPFCQQHTVDHDGRFYYRVELDKKKSPRFIKSFTFRFECCIPEIQFYDRETIQSKEGIKADNRFESIKLKKLKSFTIKIVMSIRSVSMS